MKKVWLQAQGLGTIRIVLSLGSTQEMGAFAAVVTWEVVAVVTRGVRA